MEIYLTVLEWVVGFQIIFCSSIVEKAIKTNLQIFNFLRCSSGKHVGTEGNYNGKITRNFRRKKRL
jgi:hypothetical protein